MLTYLATKRYKHNHANVWNIYGFHSAKAKPSWHKHTDNRILLIKIKNATLFIHINEHMLPFLYTQSNTSHSHDKISLIYMMPHFSYTKWNTSHIRNKCTTLFKHIMKYRSLIYVIETIHFIHIMKNLAYVYNTTFVIHITKYSS